MLLSLRPELINAPFRFWSIAAIPSSYLQLTSVEMVRHIYHLTPREMDLRGLLDVVFL